MIHIHSPLDCYIYDYITVINSPGHVGDEQEGHGTPEFDIPPLPIPPPKPRQQATAPPESRPLPVSPAAPVGELIRRSHNGILPPGITSMGPPSFPYFNARPAEDRLNSVEPSDDPVPKNADIISALDATMQALQDWGRENAVRSDLNDLETTCINYSPQKHSH